MEDEKKKEEQKQLHIEMSTFRNTLAYNKIQEYLDRRLNDSDSVMNIDLKGDIIAQVSEARGACETATKIKNFLSNLGDL